MLPALKVQWSGETVTARGTKGMAEALKATEGGIAYQEVVRQQLPAVQLQNRAGTFTAANERSIQAAVSGSEMGKSGDETASLIDLPGPEVWPITDTTYVLVPRVATDVAQAKRVLNFFYRVFSQGDKAAANTGFVPLPTRIQARLLSRFREVVGPDGRPAEFLGLGLPVPSGPVVAGATTRQ